VSAVGGRLSELRHRVPSVVDGIATGLVLSGAVLAGCRAVGGESAGCGGWLLAAGAVVALGSAPWALSDRPVPPGLFGRLGEPPSADSTKPEHAIWLDRFVSVGNAWLVAGLTMVAASFLPPLLR
jgi:hypothetical protein